VTTEGLQDWLSHLVSEADSVEARDEGWFAEIARVWTIQAKVRDLGAALGDGWTSQQVEILIDLARTARSTLTEVRVIQIADGWPGLLSDDLPPDARRHGGSLLPTPRAGNGLKSAAPVRPSGCGRSAHQPEPIPTPLPVDRGSRQLVSWFLEPR
jgi:hypothetical protein